MGKPGIMLSEQEENSLKDPRPLNMLNDSENYMGVISYPYQGTGGITYKHKKQTNKQKMESSITWMSEKESGITEWGIKESDITESVITESGITGKTGIR